MRTSVCVRHCFACAMGRLSHIKLSTIGCGMNLYKSFFLIVMWGGALAAHHAHKSDIHIDRHAIYLTPHTHAADQVAVRNTGRHTATLQARLYRVDNPGAAEPSRTEMFSLVDGDVRIGAKQFTLPANSAKTIPLRLASTQAASGWYQLALFPPQARSVSKQARYWQFVIRVVNIFIQPDKPAPHVVSSHGRGDKNHNRSNAVSMRRELCVGQRCTAVTFRWQVLFPGQVLQSQLTPCGFMPRKYGAVPRSRFEQSLRLDTHDRYCHNTQTIMHNCVLSLFFTSLFCLADAIVPVFKQKCTLLGLSMENTVLESRLHASEYAS